MTETRREFLDEVGQGMLTVLIGPALATEMGLGSCAEAEEKAVKPSAALDKLAGVLQQTPPNKLFGVLKGLLDKGTDLKSLVAAGALANAHAFAGQNYDGYHTFMALPPSYEMARELPKKEAALPIFKVLYRNSTLIAKGKCHDKDTIGEAKAADLDKIKKPADKLLQACRDRKVDEADRIITAMDKGTAAQLYEEVLPLVQDAVNVHKVVLAWRSWEVLDFTGKDYARLMLRQTVRHCSDYGDQRTGTNSKGIRDILPKVMESNKLLKREVGKRKAEDSWVEKLAKTIYGAKQSEAAEAVAAALGEGFAPSAICEALSLASTSLVLGDQGRKVAWPGKPLGSVHGDSVGVHASDAASAWCNIAGVTGARNTFASLIAAAFHTAGQTYSQMKEPYPLATEVEKVKGKTAKDLLAALEEAIKGKDQKRACAVVQRYGQLKHPAKDVFAICRKYAISEEGALHAEKYYRTAMTEFGRTRASLQWRHLIALARVTASLYGNAAQGMDEARKILKV